MADDVRSGGVGRDETDATRGGTDATRGGAPRVSLVVPVYNAERHLRECLDSVLGQTLGQVELVCVNDGSTDSSPQILSSYAARDRRVRIINQANAGAGAARNAGMSVARGDIILCIDADDMLGPDACEAISKGFSRTGCEVMSFGFRCEPEDRTPAAIATELHPRDAFFQGFHPEVLFREKVRPFAWRCALSREFFRRVGAHYDPSLSLGDDQFFLFYVYPRARKVLLSSRQLYVYRMSDDSMMHAASAEGADLEAKLQKHADAVAAILEDWGRNGWQDVCADDMLAWALDLVLLDASHLPEDEQVSFYRRYLKTLSGYFGKRAIFGTGGKDHGDADRASGDGAAVCGKRPGGRHVWRVLDEISSRLAGERAGACVSKPTLALFYLRQRGLANCVRRVVRSRF